MCVLNVAKVFQGPDGGVSALLAPRPLRLLADIRCQACGVPAQLCARQACLTCRLAVSSVSLRNLI